MSMPSSRLGPSGRAALELLECCPRIPTDVVDVLMHMRHTSSATQLLTRLGTAGLVQAETVHPGPLLGIRSVRLWSLSALGRSVVPARGAERLAKGHARLPYGGAHRLPYAYRQPDLPLLIAAYRLFGVVVSGLDQCVQVAAWEHPWVRTFLPVGQARLRHVRLPAAAVLELDSGSDPAGGWLQVLLLPDVGTVPVARYRPLIRSLLHLRQNVSPEDNRDEPLLVVATVDPGGTGARAAAWRSLLQRAARNAGEAPLRAQVLGSAAATLSYNGHDLTGRWVAQGDQMLSLVARHPLLT